MVDTYQVYLARHYSADAILLMLSVLDDGEYKALAGRSLTPHGCTYRSQQRRRSHRAVALKAKDRY